MAAGVCRFPALNEVVYAAEGDGCWWQIGNAFSIFAVTLESRQALIAGLAKSVRICIHFQAPFGLPFLHQKLISHGFGNARFFNMFVGDVILHTVICCR